MDYLLNTDQAAMLEAVGSILDREAGPARAASLLRADEYDHPLHTTLATNGFLDVAAGPDTGPLEATLVVEEVAAAAGIVAVGATALVLPAVFKDVTVGGPIALAQRGGASLVRYGADAVSLLGIDGPDVVLIPLAAGDVKRVKSTLGSSIGRLAPEIWDREPVAQATGAAAQMLAGWRLAIAAEICGAMRGAMQTTVAYLGRREQFGRPIASFQAVQHRLADCAVLIEGSTWLTRCAAASGGVAEAAEAGAYAAETARKVAYELHQLSGAIGLTKEYALHVWTTRIFGLSLELGGHEAHARDAATYRWDEKNV